MGGRVSEVWRGARQRAVAGKGNDRVGERIAGIRIGSGEHDGFRGVLDAIHGLRRRSRGVVDSETGWIARHRVGSVGRHDGVIADISAGNRGDRERQRCLAVEQLRAFIPLVTVRTGNLRARSERDWGPGVDALAERLRADHWRREIRGKSDHSACNREGSREPGAEIGDQKIADDEIRAAEIGERVCAASFSSAAEVEPIRSPAMRIFVKSSRAEGQRVGCVAGAEVHLHLARPPVNCGGIESADAVVPRLHAAAIEQDGAHVSGAGDAACAADDDRIAACDAAGDEQAAFLDLRVAEIGVRGAEFERAVA